MGLEGVVWGRVREVEEIGIKGIEVGALGHCPLIVRREWCFGASARHLGWLLFSQGSLVR